MWGPHDGVSHPIRRGRETPLSLLEFAPRKGLVWTQSMVTVHEPGEHSQTEMNQWTQRSKARKAQSCGKCGASVV